MGHRSDWAVAPWQVGFRDTFYGLYFIVNFVKLYYTVIRHEK